MIFVKIPNMGDESIRTTAYDTGNWFVADSFSFGVEREMKESGEKGGTEAINIGVGELQECTISKSMDMASMDLAQYSINGNSMGTAEIDFVEIGGNGADGSPVCYLKYKLDRCFVKSWSVSGDADDRPTEEVALYFHKIASQFVMTKDGQVLKQSSVMAWDKTKQITWDSPGIRW